MNKASILIRIKFFYTFLFYRLLISADTPRSRDKGDAESRISGINCDRVTDCGTSRLCRWQAGMQIRKGRTHAHEHVLAFCERFSFQKQRSGGDQLAIFPSLPSRIFARQGVREKERERRKELEKTPKRTKMSVAIPSSLHAPASCGSFRKNRRPVGFYSKARVTGAHLRISQRNFRLTESDASAISTEAIGTELEMNR